MGYLTAAQLASVGFGRVGVDVQLSDRTSIYGPAGITIGDHVRIDDFCVLSAGAGGIAIGSHVHVACFCSLIGAGRIELGDFSGVSSRVAVISSTDDFSGQYLTGPTVPLELRRVIDGPVTIGRHVIVGAGAVILPGVQIGDGCAVGALTLVNRSCEPFGVYVGSPARRIGERDRGVERLERQWLGGDSER